jgi:hypothetical protein
MDGRTAMINAGIHATTGSTHYIIDDEEDGEDREDEEGEDEADDIDGGKGGKKKASGHQGPKWKRLKDHYT